MRTLLVLAFAGMIASAAESIADQLQRAQITVEQSKLAASLAKAQVILADASKECESNSNPVCPRVYDWLGVLIESQHLNDLQILREQVVPLYAKAVELSNGNPSPLALELQGLALKRLGEPGATELLLKAGRARRDSIAALGDRNEPAADITIEQMKSTGAHRPELRKRLEPDYPLVARLLRLQGTVVVKIVVGKDGRPHQCELTKSIGFGFDEATVQAVKRWIFQPGKLNGKPVAVEAMIEMAFKRVD